MAPIPLYCLDSSHVGSPHFEGDQTIGCHSKARLLLAMPRKQLSNSSVQKFSICENRTGYLHKTTSLHSSFNSLTAAWLAVASPRVSMIRLQTKCYFKSDAVNYWRGTSHDR